MEPVSLRRKLYIKFVAGIFNAYFSIYHHWQVEGTEHIVRRGPLFVLINHISLLEPFALGVALVRCGITPGRDIMTVAKKELFESRLSAAFLRSIGMFPIDREATDMAAMRTMLSILRDKKMIAMAPEGTRSPTGQLQALQPVVAKIAITRRIPILPAGAFGAEKALPVGAKFPRPAKITLRFGPVFELSEFYDQPMTDALADRASWVMREHIAELLPEWMRQLPPPSGRVGARKI
jgi:1-acyl-sn-glycerol-3-phosphate acyltransferase